MITGIPPQSLIGTWRRFGPVGPPYEIRAFRVEQWSDFTALARS